METTITVEVEVKVDFTPIKAERMTMDYPGCPAHLEINDITLPTVDEIMAEHEQAIHDACWDEVREAEYEQKISRYEEKNINIINEFVRENINKQTGLKI